MPGQEEHAALAPLGCAYVKSDLVFPLLPGWNTSSRWWHEPV